MESMKDDTARNKRDACKRHGIGGFILERCKTPAACAQATEADTFSWSYKGHDYRFTIITAACPMCHKRAVVKLYGPLLDEQTDGTTLLCHPLRGGCNYGLTTDLP